MKRAAFTPGTGKLPWPLEEQIWHRLMLGAAAALVSVVVLYCVGLEFGVPWIMLTLYGIGSGIVLAGNALGGRVTVLKGKCRAVEIAGLRKRAKTVVLLVDGIPVRIQLRQRHCALHEGDIMIVYVASQTPVYMKDGCDYLDRYYAIEIAGSAQTQ